MRYFTYITVIVIGLSAVCAYLMFYNPVTVPFPAIVINKRVVPMQELREVVTRRPPYQTKQEAIDQLISRELLIQEAMERGLDKDPRFLERVRSFYEKNLIQGLLEDQMEAITLASMEAKTIDRYAGLMNKTVMLKETTFPDEGALAHNEPEAVNHVEKPFSALSSTLRFQIAEAGQGAAVVVRKGDKQIVYEMLDTAPMEQDLPAVPRDKIEEMIVEAGRQVLLDEWIDGLRKKADINIINTDIEGTS